MVTKSLTTLGNEIVRASVKILTTAFQNKHICLYCLFDPEVDAFGREYMFERALDGDPDTYFWGISPKRHDTMDAFCQLCGHLI